VRRTAALIAGGGPAGAAAAILLARGGARPELIERHRAPPEIVCGGFLGWDALALLGRLGIDAAALGAHPIGRLRVIRGERIVEAALPHAAAGLSRRALDTALLAGAERAGVAIERGTAIRRAEGRTLHLADGGEIAGDALFLATGKHELRGLARPKDAAGHDPSTGLRSFLPASPALRRTLDGVIELHLFDRGYAGLLLQEDRTANLCLSVARSRVAGGIDALIADLARESPHLGERLAASPPSTWAAVAGVPYGWRTEETQPGIFRLGDQAGVIASLAGDGVAIALASGTRAARAFLRDGAAGAEGFQRAFAARSARPIGVAGRLRHIAERRHAAWLLPLLRLPGLPGLLARATRIGD
jgi:flavin-dependent dehydrogenase